MPSMLLGKRRMLIFLFCYRIVLSQRFNGVLWSSYPTKIVTSCSNLPSGVDNLRRTYHIHQTYFSLTLGDYSLEDYYAKFHITVRSSTFASLPQIIFRFCDSKRSLCMWLSFCLACLCHMIMLPSCCGLKVFSRLRQSIVSILALLF